MIEPNDTRECGVLRGRRHKNLFHVQRYPLHDARDVPRAIRPGGGAARFSASLLARPRHSTRVPRAASTPTDDAADKRKNPALYDGSLHTAAADDASRVALALAARRGAN